MNIEELSAVIFDNLDNFEDILTIRDTYETYLEEISERVYLVSWLYDIQSEVLRNICNLYFDDTDKYSERLSSVNEHIVYSAYADIVNIMSKTNVYFFLDETKRAVLPLKLFTSKFCTRFEDSKIVRLYEILERFKFFKSLDLSNVDALKAVEAHFKTTDVVSHELPILE